MQLVIGGYIGYDNLGDEAILSVLLAQLNERFPGAVPLVLSNDPGATTSMHGVDAVDRNSPKGVLAALRSSDAYLSAGGLLQDITSRRSASYYLTLHSLAQRRMPIYLIGHGLGPLKRRWIMAWTAHALRHVDGMMFRDRASAAIARSWGVPRHRILRGGDLALLLDERSSAQSSPLEGAARRAGPIVVCLKGPLPAGAERDWAHAIDRLAERSRCQIAFFAFHRKQDGPAMAAVAARMAHRSWQVDPSGVQPAEALRAISEASAVISMRLHPLIFASMSGTPAVAISRAPKVTAFTTEMARLGGPIVAQWQPDSLPSRPERTANALLAALRAQGEMRTEILRASCRLRVRTEKALAAMMDRMAARLENQG